MILITGANGHLGSATIDFLLKKIPGAGVKAMVRNEEKGKHLKEKGVEIAIGDYSDFNSLLKATENVETVMLISSSSLGERYTHHSNVIKAAKQNGVKNIVHTSILKVNPDSKFSESLDYVKTEKDILSSGLSYTIMRNTYYADYLPDIIGNASETSAIYFSAGSSKVNFALRKDMAEANAVVLSNLPEHKNKIYEITSADTYSFNDIASMLSSITGKDIKYVDLPVETLKENILKLGMPERVAELMGSIAESMKAREFDFIDPALENLLGRKPVSLEKFLKQKYS